MDSTLEAMAREAASDVERQWEMGGLSDCLYGDFAVEVAKRVAAIVRARALEDAARIAETPFTGEQDDITMAAKDRVAAAIRALSASEG